MAKPLAISILLSVRNGAAHLPQALGSLSEQTEQAWECLIMDDGSTDATPEILKTWTDQRFRVFKHAESRGLTTSLIELAAQTRAPYLARHDADDWSHPKRLEISAKFSRSEFAMSPPWDQAMTYTTRRAAISIRSDLGRLPNFIRRALNNKNPFAHGSLMMRRQLRLSEAERLSPCIYLFT